MRRICPFCQNDLNDVWKDWKAGKKFDETAASICMSCGEIVMVGRDGLRKPTTDEHIALADNGGIIQARQLWLDAKGETDQASSEIAATFKSLQYASRKAPAGSQLMFEGIYWRAAKATYDTLIAIFEDEKQSLPTRLVDRLELIGALIEAGNDDTKTRLCTKDSPIKRKTTSV
jgi:hypothetical protein